MILRKVGEKDGLILLADEEGNRAQFDFLEMTVVDGGEYAALLQCDTQDIILLCMSEDAAGKESYATIENDLLFDRVLKAFEEIFEEDD